VQGSYELENARGRDEVIAAVWMLPYRSLGEGKRVKFEKGDYSYPGHFHRGCPNKSRRMTLPIMITVMPSRVPLARVISETMGQSCVDDYLAHLNKESSQRDLPNFLKPQRIPVPKV
jgi:hypothetical protein